MLAAALVFMMTAAVSLDDAAPQYADIVVLRDFAADFGMARLENPGHPPSSQRESIAGESLPGIFIHPTGEGETRCVYADVAVPAGGGPVFLLFHTGLRDMIPWNASPPPNGVRFALHVAGEKVFEGDWAQCGWRSGVLDMRPWAGQLVEIAFAVEAIDGMSNYDWSVWGEPLLVQMAPAANALPELANGVALAEVEMPAVGEMTLSMGEASATVSLPQGRAWVQLPFNRMLPLLSESPVPGARVATLWVGAHSPALKAEQFALSSPLVLAGEPFGAALRVKNAGRGHYPGGAALELTVSTLGASRDALPVPGNRVRTLGPLAPGESSVLTWDNVAVPAMGDYLMGVVGAVETGGPAPPTPVAFHAFPPAPEAFTGRVEQQPDGTRFTGVLGQAADRLRMKVVEDASRQSYLIAEVREAGEWKRAGSLYPMAAAMVRTTDGGTPRRAVLGIQDGDIFADRAEARGQILGNPVRFTATPDPERGRVRITCTFTAAEPLELLSFSGPQVLAGDRAYGAAKDFAVFGGMEYLEGGEESSSERDLAPPLNERFVPAIHKLASPVMAVQGRDTLIGLLWDPKQAWAPDERFPAAHFQAPGPDAGLDTVQMSLFAPSVGRHIPENTFTAETPHPMNAGDTVTLDFWLILDAADNYPEESIVHGPHRGGLLLQAYQHYFDLFGLPEPSPQPRDWAAEQALSLKGYFEAVWSEDPPGWAHCHNWKPGLHVGHAVPLLLMEREAAPDVRAEIRRRVDLVLERVLAERGPQYLWNGVGCHIMNGELPFLEGFTAAALSNMAQSVKGLPDAREDGLWRWRPQSAQYAKLGVAGDHTLSQAAQPLYMMLRAARLSGDRELLRAALEAMPQMLQHDVPRGAQTWECPLYQPDILAAAQAIRAYTEAYRMTGDAAHLAHARYWAWTGLPFLYLWDMEGYPTMRYNVIAVMGSTFFTHSWIGLPVVWCGLVYAYALQDLAEFDDSFPWRTVAQGITNSAMHQQYTVGPSAGTYPDSWHMVENRPVPADINPENILVNELRLRGRSPEMRFHRLDTSEGPVVVNSAADISAVNGVPGPEGLTLTLTGPSGHGAYTLIAPVDRPATVTGAGEMAADEAALRAQPAGWVHDPALRAVVLKTAGTATVGVKW